MGLLRWYGVEMVWTTCGRPAPTQRQQPSAGYLRMVAIGQASRVGQCDQGVRSSSCRFGTNLGVRSGCVNDEHTSPQISHSGYEELLEVVVMCRLSTVVSIRSLNALRSGFDSPSPTPNFAAFDNSLYQKVTFWGEPMGANGCCEDDLCVLASL